MDLRVAQTSLVHDLFVRTADENYITARWCAVNNLNTDFFWLAVHSLEKYFKAVILLNGGSSKKFRHDIVKLYAAVKTIAEQLLPKRLQQPPKLDIPYWIERSAEDFVSHLLRHGNADNRYLIYGYSMRSQDLHMLDQMVFSVRRLICPLDEHFIQSDDPNAPTFTNRELLTRDSEYYCPLALPLDDLIRAKDNTPTRTAALNLNMAFAPSDFPHTPVSGRSTSRETVILRRILDPLESDDQLEANEGLKIAQWFLDKVQLPREDPGDPGIKKQIKDAMDMARDKHGTH